MHLLLLIAGVAASSHSDVQNNLCDTRYNELLLLALKHFDSDLLLIRYGCYALYATCRAHSVHQSKLHNLHIMPRLSKLLKKHGEEWRIVDSIVCTMIGLLEPAADVQNSSQIKGIMDEYRGTLSAASSGLLSAEERSRRAQMKKTMNKRMSQFDSYKILNIILKEDVVVQNSEGTEAEQEKEVKISLLEKLALHVAEFQMEDECGALAGNYLKLVGCFGYWKPYLLQEWRKGIFVRLTLNPNIDKKLLKNFFSMVGTLYKDKVENVAALKEGKKVLERADNDENLQSTIKEACETMKGYFENNCSLVRFLMVSMDWQKKQSYVLAAALGLYTKIIRGCLLDDSLALGRELEYFSQKTGANDLLRERYFAVNAGIINMCMQCKVQRDPNPMLIRYSLWLLVIFISQKDNECATAVESAIHNIRIAIATYVLSEGHMLNRDADCSVGAITAQLAIEGMIEWAIDVMDRCDKYYSIQCLATVFLYWMESHGHLGNREPKLLRKLKAILERNQACKRSQFLSLNEEGHDGYLIGDYDESGESAFGRLELHCSKLLRTLDMQLECNVSVEYAPPVRLSIDGVALATITENASSAMWDGVCRPMAITVPLSERETDPDNSRQVDTYAFDIQWNKCFKDDVDIGTWRVTYRYRTLDLLNRSLQRQLKHLNNVIPKEFELPPKNTLNKLMGMLNVCCNCGIDAFLI